ncbi:MAG: exodeoxyribonuclease VII large subunit [Traorella sp.]
MIKQMWSVTSLVNYIKKGIDHDENLTQLLVQGEISNLVKHRSGHYYFTLKDEKSRMNCVMFSNYARLIRFNLENGNKVIVQCKVSVYEASGSVQLYVNAIQLDGIGDLYYQFELLKKKLYQEGYFNENHKKPLPEYPMDIAVISAKEAAAKHDVLTTIKRRWPLAKITFYASLVQGKEASKELIDTLQKVDKLHHEVILLVRGGGSIEDLWAFNSEQLAKCIYHMDSVIVSGVGHESDTTLVDYVCDARGATPTAAAELITPDISEVKAKLMHLKIELYQKINHHIKDAVYELDMFHAHPYIKNPMSFIENRIMSLDYKRNQLDHEYIKIIQKKQEILNIKDKMIYTMKAIIEKKDYLIKNSKKQLQQISKTMYKEQLLEHQKHIELLDAYSPLKVLYRGYSLTKVENSYVHEVNDVRVGEQIKTILKDGILISTVVQKEKNHG